MEGLLLESRKFKSLDGETRSIEILPFELTDFSLVSQCALQ